MKKSSRFEKKRTLLSSSRICGALLAAMISTASFGQGVGINTTSPDPSAALDIQGSDKGVLIPRVSLQNSVDKTTVPTPANGLLVYNTNEDAFLTGTGFYYNTGTPDTPHWISLSELKLPFVKGGASTGSLFSIGNYNNTSDDNSAISATSTNGYALKTDGKIKISGAGQEPGSGKVLTSDGSGNATWVGGAAFSVMGVLQNGAHILAKNTDYKIPFAVEAYDIMHNYNVHSQSNSDTFIAPESGIYHFDFQIFWEGDKSATVSLVKMSSGVATILAENRSQGSMYDASVDVKLSQNDQVYVHLVHGNEEHLTVYKEGYFNGRFVQSIK